MLRILNLTGPVTDSFMLSSWMRLKSRSLLVFVGSISLVVGCGSRDTRAADSARDTARAAGDSMAIAPAFAVPPIPGILTCAPDVLRPGDVLTMRMKVPHGRYFMAISPDRTQYLVVFPGEGSPDRTQRKSLMSSDAFVNIAELNLDPRTLRAGAWVFGRDTNETVFITPGTYRLMVGSDMETDGPQYAECLVRWAP